MARKELPPDLMNDQIKKAGDFGASVLERFLTMVPNPPGLVPATRGPSQSPPQRVALEEEI
jgi:hypothetical protein